jgi:hypothetical protein
LWGGGGDGHVGRGRVFIPSRYPRSARAINTTVKSGGEDDDPQEPIRRGALYDGQVVGRQVGSIDCRPSLAAPIRVIFAVASEARRSRARPVGRMMAGQVSSRSDDRVWAAPADIRTTNSHSRILPRARARLYRSRRAASRVCARAIARDPSASDQELPLS